MLTCLENLTSNPSITPAVDAILFDGAALVNMLKPSRACTVLCKSNKSKFRRNSCFVLVKIPQEFSRSRRKFVTFREILLRTSKNRRNKISTKIRINFYMETTSNPSDAADLPISPIVTINEADMSAAIGDEALQLSGMGTEDEISLKGPPLASAGPNSTTCRCACKQKKVTPSDVLRLQYETLQCKKETLLLKNRQSRTTCSYFCSREIKNRNGLACNPDKTEDDYLYSCIQSITLPGID